MTYATYTVDVIIIYEPIISILVVFKTLKVTSAIADRSEYNVS